MNLLYTLTSYPPAVGGAQLLMHRLAVALAARHQIQVVTIWDRERTDWLLGTTVFAPLGGGSYQIDGVAVARAALPLSRRLRLLPWVLAYHGLQGPALRRIARAFAEQLTPHAADVHLVHNCRIGREPLSFASLAAARRRGVPFVLTPVHHPRWGGWTHRHYQELYRQADAVIALTAAERRSLVDLGVDHERVFVTGMGPTLAERADPLAFRKRRGWGDEPIVLFLGQKYAYKGLAQLLDAAPLVWAKVPDARFVFLGPRTAFSRRLFARVRDPRVLELGTVDLQEKTDALAACALLCLPSAQESFGAVFAEAWAMGRPVVGRDIPAVREVIADGEDGLLAPADAGGLADRLRRLLAEPALAAHLGRRGKEKVEARFSWPRLAELTEEVYRAAWDRLGR